jgi:hypothetical protein
MLLLLWLQVPNPPSNAPAGIAYIWWVILLVLAIAAGLIFLFTRRQERVEVVNEKRASAAEGLVKTRDTELADCLKARQRAEEDLGDTKAELYALSGITCQKLLEFWAVKEQIEGENIRLKAQVRVLQIAAGVREKGAE